MTYTLQGPFTNGGPPGLGATIFNNFDTALAALNSAAFDSNISSANGIATMLGLDLNPAAASLSGTAGTANLYQPLQGLFKVAVVQWGGFANTSAGNLALPVPFTSIAGFFVYETQGGTVTFRLSGSNVTCSVLNTISASSGGTQSPITAIKAWSQGQTRSGFDTIQVLFNGGTNATGLMLVYGF